MAKLARQVGGGLDAVIAMTRHKDLKLADHCSRTTEDDQKHFSKMIMKYIRNKMNDDSYAETDFENVIRLKRAKAN